MGPVTLDEKHEILDTLARIIQEYEAGYTTATDSSERCRINTGKIPLARLLHVYFVLYFEHLELGATGQEQEMEEAEDSLMAAWVPVAVSSQSHQQPPINLEDYVPKTDFDALQKAYNALLQEKEAAGGRWGVACQSKTHHTHTFPEGPLGSGSYFSDQPGQDVQDLDKDAGPDHDYCHRSEDVLAAALDVGYDDYTTGMHTDLIHLTQAAASLFLQVTLLRWLQFRKTWPTCRPAKISLSKTSCSI